MSLTLRKIVTKQVCTGVRYVAGGTGTIGSGVGKGGGGGGAIREAGGAFGAMEAAREEQYFYNKQKEQLKALKEHLSGQIEFHKDQIRRHQEALKLAHSRVADITENDDKKTKEK